MARSRQRVAARPPVGAPPARELDEAERLLAAGQPALAERLLGLWRADAAGAVQPGQEARACNLLAIALLGQRRAAEALVPARRAVAAQPGDARFAFTLGRVLKESGDLEAADAEYRRALALQPGFVEAMVSLGIVHKLRDRPAEAITWYDRALALQPRFAPALANKANARALLAARTAEGGVDDTPDDEAIATAQAALAADPRSAPLARNLGVLLMAARRRREAADAFNHALGLEPSDVETCLRLAHCISAVGDGALARDLYRQWLARFPRNVVVMRALSALLTREGSIDESLALAREAVELDPDPAALVYLGGALQQARQHEDALAHARRAVSLAARSWHLYPTLLMGLNYASDDVQEVMATHAAYGRALPPAREDRPRWHALAPRERLKVAYLSGDFVRHSVSFFVAALFSHHDRDRFEVYCFHNLGWTDAVSREIQATGVHWIECEGWSDDLLRRRIRAEGIHVVVDLSGHTSHHRLGTLAMGAAPVQLTYLGYPTVTGVPAIDWRITDGVIDPGDVPGCGSDHPLRLPRTMFCYRPHGDTPIGPAPARANGCVTFGSFNNIAKLTDRTLAMWARVLATVPGSRLLLKAAAMAQRTNREGIERFMAARGIEAGRLRFEGWIADKGDHLALYNEVDVALDPFPYNGATTTCEALWMGLPVVSRRGRTHPSRMGASILSAAGLDAWLCDDDDAYVATAVALARDATARDDWRGQARERLRASPLMDEPGFTADFEQLLQTAWQRAAP